MPIYIQIFPVFKNVRGYIYYMLRILLTKRGLCVPSNWSCWQKSDQDFFLKCIQKWRDHNWQYLGSLTTLLQVPIFASYVFIATRTHFICHICASHISSLKLNVYIYAIMKTMCSSGYHHKAIVVKTGRAHCSHDCTYVTLILLLWDLSTLYVCSFINR